MGWYATLQAEKRFRAPWDDFWYEPISRATQSGEEVSPESAVELSAVWAAVSLIASTLAMLPLHLRQRTGPKSSDVIRDHAASRVLNLQPNRWQTDFELVEMLQGHVLLRGNAFAEIITDRRGGLRELIPLHPSRVKVEVDGARITYLVKRDDGTERRLPQDRVFHLRGLGSNGFTGYSPVTLARESLGLTKASEAHGARFYKNQSVPRGILKTPNRLTNEARKNLGDSWSGAYGGQNAHKVAVLDEGLEWQAVGFSAEDSQFLETRQFQILEVARWFNVPPHKLREMTHATFSNIEHQGIEWVQDTIQPWATRWEKRAALSLLTERERQNGLFFKWNLNALLRGDVTSRAQFYDTLFRRGALSPNDIRELEDQNPQPDGDRYFVDANVVPIDMAGAQFANEPQPEFGEEEDETGRSAVIDLRAVRAELGLQNRRNLQRAFQNILTEAARRVVAREATGIERLLPTLEQRDISDFRRELQQFYEDFRPSVRRQFEGPVTEYGNLVIAAARDEMSIEETAEELAFIEAYLDSLVERHTRSGRRQINALLTEEPESSIEAIMERLEGWREGRPAKIGLAESTRAGGAFAKHAWVIAGVSLLVWRAFGKTCPLCTSIDGKIVGTQQPFVNKGDVVAPDGTSPFRAQSNIGHPPLHRGCDCLIQPA